VQGTVIVADIFQPFKPVIDALKVI